LGGQDAREQQGGVNGRQLRVPRAFAAVPFYEMVEPTALMLLHIGEMTQRGSHSLADFVQRTPLPREADAQRRQRKAGAGDAGNFFAAAGCPLAIVPRAVEGKPGLGLRVFPVEEKGALREVLQKRVVSRRNGLFGMRQNRGTGSHLGQVLTT